jgi:predicted nucleotidyltransferase
MITDAHLDELKEIFVKHGVVLAYLFGSQAEGAARPSSDIDLAVLLPSSFTSVERFRIQLKLMDDCSTAFQRDDVDVAVLNEASPLLAYEVVKHGKLLYEDETSRPAIDFAVYTLSRYADTAPFRNLQNQYLFDRIRQHKANRELAQGRA